MATVTIFPEQGANGIHTALQAGYDVQLVPGVYFAATTRTVNTMDCCIYVPAGRTLRGAGKNKSFIFWTASQSTTGARCIASKAEANVTLDAFTVMTQQRNVRNSNGTSVVDQGNIVFSQSGATLVTGLTMTNVRSIDGPIQQLQFNGVQAAVVTDCDFESTTRTKWEGTVYAGHGVDIDVTFADTQTTVTFTRCTFRAVGQECLKYENGAGTHVDCTFYTRVTHTQDTDNSGTTLSPYSFLGPMVYTGCTFYDSVNIFAARNRHVPASSGPFLYDNGGDGTFAFTRCRFIGTDAMIWCSDNTSARAYQSVTCTGTAFESTNSHFLNSGATNTFTNCTGVKDTLTAWIAKGDAVGIDTNNLGAPYLTKRSAGGAGAANVLSSIFSASWSNMTPRTKVNFVFMPGTYYTADLGSLTLGTYASGSPTYVTYVAEKRGTVVLDGTGAGNTAAFTLTGASTALHTFSGFIFRNWGYATPGSSSRALTINAATANVVIADNIFEYNDGNGGGSALRIQNAASATVKRNIIRYNRSSAGNGVVLFDVANIFFYGNTVYSNTAAAAGIVRFGGTPAVAMNSIVAGNLIYNNNSSASGAIQLSSSSVNLAPYICNNTLFGNTGGAGVGQDIAVFWSAAATSAFIYNNICRSGGTNTAVAPSINKTGGGNITYTANDYVSLVAVSGTNTDGGSNTTTAPSLTADYRLPAGSTLRNIGTIWWSSLTPKPFGPDGEYFDSRAASKTHIGCFAK